MAATAWLSLGSNEAPEANLRSAVAALRGRFAGVRVSPVYRTPAVGFDGPDFLNCAATIESDLDVHALDAWLHALEDAHGRDRRRPRFSSRTLDVDIVFYGDLVLAGPGHLQVPRPELQHDFVLAPLRDLDPRFRVPGDGRTLDEWWAARGDRPPPERISLALD